MLGLIDNFIKHDLIDFPDTLDSKKLKIKTLPINKKPQIKVLISGASSPLALPLLFSIAKGYIFGDDTQLVIVLFDFTKYLIRHAKALEAELSMGGFKLLIDIIVSNIPSESFKGVDIAIFLETQSPLQEFVPVSEKSLNVQQYRYLGCALNLHAKRSIKVVFVGGNVNTKALICSLYAPHIPIINFTGLSCHLAARANVELAEIFKVPRVVLSGVLVWGISTVDTSYVIKINHDTKQVTNVNEEMNVIQFFLRESENHRTTWNELQLCTVEAIKKHIYVLLNGTKMPFPMVVISEGCYNTDPGLFISLPVVIDDNETIRIKKNLRVHPDVERKLLLEFDKLKKDRAQVLKYISENNHSKLIRSDLIQHLL